MEIDVFSADQLLQDHSVQEGIHAFPRTMMVSTSPAGGVFELPFTNLSLSSRRTIYGPDVVASSHSAALGAGRAVTTAPACRGGLVVRRRRWTGPTALSAG